MISSKLHYLLKRYYNYDSFRPNQLTIIENILNQQDCVALLPTGGGKSICYQLPCIYLQSKCLVISPLIALMEDQVESLAEKNIPAFVVHSGMDNLKVLESLNNFKRVEYGLLYISPERLTNASFKDYIKGIELSHVAIDEAHCISQWGHDFRPTYLEIANLIKSLNGSPQITALTATATSSTLLEIIKYSGLKNPSIVKSSFKRSNIGIEIIKSHSPFQDLRDYFKLYQGNTSIVYLRSRRGVKVVAEQLNAAQIDSRYYHGHMSFHQRKSIATDWKNGIFKTICATNAFGMGIDKSDVRAVFHLDIPPSIEEYYQEIGRAGRDGKAAIAKTYIGPDTLSKFIENTYKTQVSIQDLKVFLDWLELQIKANNSRTLYPVILRDVGKELGMHPFKIFSCLQILEKSGKVFLSEGLKTPSRIRFYAPKVKTQTFHIKKENRYKIAEYLLRNYEHLFDAHIVVVEEHIANVLELDLQNVLDDLRQLAIEKIISYEERKDIPLLKVISDLKMSFAEEALVRNQEVKKTKALAMIDFINSEKCRMQNLMDYFGESSDPCHQCDICTKENKVGSSLDRFYHKVMNATPHQPVVIREALTALNLEERKRAIRKLQLLENEEKIQVINGVVVGVRHLNT
jgi:ATP-dependent DNA helicase RecQ